MNLRLKRFYTFVGLLLISANGFADGHKLLEQCLITEQFMDGNDLTVKDALPIGYCLGLTQGVRASVDVIADNSPGSINICTPTQVTNGQVVRIVMAFLRENPDKLHEDEAVLVIRALIEAYPCKH